MESYRLPRHGLRLYLPPPQVFAIYQQRFLSALNVLRECEVQLNAVAIALVRKYQMKNQQVRLVSEDTAATYMCVKVPCHWFHQHLRHARLQKCQRHENSCAH